MSKRDIGQEILEGIQEIKAHKAGGKELRTHTLKEPAPPQSYPREMETIAGCICRFDGR